MKKMNVAVSVVAIAVGAILIVWPSTVAYFMGAFLIIKGLFDLFKK